MDESKWESRGDGTVVRTQPQGQSLCSIIISVTPSFFAGFSQLNLQNLHAKIIVKMLSLMVQFKVIHGESTLFFKRNENVLMGRNMIMY